MQDNDGASEAQRQPSAAGATPAVNSIALGQLEAARSRERNGLEPATGTKLCTDDLDTPDAGSRSGSLSIDVRQCGHCGTGGASMSCAKSKVVLCCDRTCQKDTWKSGHKEVCSSPPPAALTLSGSSGVVTIE